MKQRKQFDHYVTAAIPEPYFIGLVKLRPYSIGHVLLMRRFDCAFGDENPERSGGIIDLYLGLAICSRTYEDFLEFIQTDDEFDRWCKEWGDTIEKYIVQYVDGTDLKEKVFIYFMECISLFKQYMNDGIIVPAYWEGSGNDGIDQSGAHWSQEIIDKLESELHYDFTEAVNMPAAKAIAEVFKRAENSGALTLKADWQIDEEEKQTEKETVKE